MWRSCVIKGAGKSATGVARSGLRPRACERTREERRPVEVRSV